MSARTVIDSLDFASSGAQLSGDVQVVQLGRLTDSLHDSAGRLNFALAGEYDSRQRPRLRLTVTGSINLRCQRCLGRLEYPVAIETSLLVLVGVAGGESAEIEDLDGVPSNPHIDVWDLVEDEVLLAVPISPRHADGTCSAAVDSGRDRAVSPFAALAKLKQLRNQK
jgi:uncharacterized protein